MHASVHPSIYIYIISRYIYITICIHANHLLQSIMRSPKHHKLNSPCSVGRHLLVRTWPNGDELGGFQSSHVHLFFYAFERSKDVKSGGFAIASTCFASHWAVPLKKICRTLLNVSFPGLCLAVRSLARLKLGLARLRRR